MSRGNLRSPATQAGQALHIEQMTRFGSEVAWLTDPRLIPEAALTYTHAHNKPLSDPYFNLATWMIDQLATWTRVGHARLSLEETFESRELSIDERVSVRNRFRLNPESSYTPGVDAMSEIHAVIPDIAEREGLERAEWGDLASESRRFGALLASRGTLTQGVVRRYLSKEPKRFGVGLRYDPAKLRLDEETGISSVTPVEQLVASARRVIQSINGSNDRLFGVCQALQASPEGLDAPTMFDAVWDAYGFMAAAHIYPTIEPAKSTAVAPIDSNPELMLEAAFAFRPR